MKIIYLLAVFIFTLPFLLGFTIPSRKLEANDIHFNSIVVDSHNDTMLKVIDQETLLPLIDIGNDTNNHVDIPKLKKGGIDILFFAAYAEEIYDNVYSNINRTLSLINALYWTEKNNQDTFEIINSVDDIQKISCPYKIGAIPAIEGGYSLDRNNGIELLKQYHDLGIRVLGFTWNTSNVLGEGASRVYGDVNKTPSQGGLTEFGKDILKEMNRLGMLVDVSHMAESTFWDIIDNANAPIMATHSGVYSLRNHPRNLRDAQLKALARRGGVIGLVLYPDFLIDGYPDKAAYIKDYVDHIDYAVNLIGIDHVGIGTDFDGATLPVDLKDSSQTYKITEELIARGYSGGDIEKILGKNTLRVLKEVEGLAEEDIGSNSKIKIKHAYSMGHELPLDTLNFTATIEKPSFVNIDYNRAKIIIDGIVYDTQYDMKTSKIELQLKQPLEKGFHVLTFVIKELANGSKRDTVILHLK